MKASIKRKFCRICEKDFPWTPEFFHYWNKSIGRLHVYCKSCKVNYVMAWKHGEKFKKIQRRVRAIKPKVVLKIKPKIKIKKRVVVEKKILKRKPIAPELNRPTHAVKESRLIDSTCAVIKKKPRLKKEIRIIAKRNTELNRSSNPRMEAMAATREYLGNRISTSELFDRIRPFYLDRTQQVVTRLRARMGLHPAKHRD